MALAARYADWPRMLRSETAHVHLGTLLFLVILWLVRATFGGASLHFLGIGGLTLSAGPALALVGGAVVVAGTTALRDAPAANAGLAFLSLVAVPVFVQWAVLLLVRRALPRNPFAWFFVVAFLGGGASFFAGALAGGALGKPLAIDWSEYALITLMLAFGEGTLTGMLLTLGVVYRPAWVATFEDRRDLEQI
jgi:uncharacterized membrane protein